MCIRDRVPCVGDDGTYTATFTPVQHPEYYKPLTAPVKLAIEKAEVSAIPMQNLYYSWAAKGEKEVQIPGLPEDRGTTELINMVKSDDANVLATDQAIRYSEGKLIFTLGENTMDCLLYTSGWLNYYSIADMKRNIEDLNGWLYRRIRMCIWKQWKLPRTRMRKLIGLGVASHYAATIANDRKGYWFNAGNKAVNWALNKERLISWGYYDLATAYQSMHVNY